MVFASTTCRFSDPSENQESDIVQYSGKKLGRRFTWAGPTITIGSGPDADIVIEEDSVSPVHARLTREPTGYYVEDLGSERGTYLLDVKVDGRKRFIDGDIFRFGEVIVKFFAGSPPV
ncbi:MAG: hypothetical protein RL011_2044 [Pseudomonadota bacterium]